MLLSNMIIPFAGTQVVDQSGQLSDRGALNGMIFRDTQQGCSEDSRVYWRNCVSI